MYYIVLYFKKIMYYIGTIFWFGKSINVLYFWKIRVATLHILIAKGELSGPF